MGIIADIGKVTIGAIKLAIDIKKQSDKEQEKVEKTTALFKQEIHFNYDLLSKLAKDGKQKPLKADDPNLVKTLAKLKTASMQTVALYPKKYKYKPTKKTGGYIDTLNLTLHKINILKEHLEIPPKTPIRPAVRIGYILRCLDKLKKDN